MLTQERLKELLNYDPETGHFTWIKRTSSASRVAIGSVAGWVNSKGYIGIKIEDKNYTAHRLVFLFMEGGFPPDQVDHINRVRDDNRWLNLRHADCFINAQNKIRESGKCNNKSGVVGVHQSRSKWRARGYRINGETAKSLGCFDYFLQACAARWEYEALNGLEIN